MLVVEGLAAARLAPVSFSLKGGACLAVRGRSGAGKTVLLRALADLDPSTGRVELDGVSRAAMSGPQWRARVGYVAAEPGWWAERVGAHFSDWPAARELLVRLGLAQPGLAQPDLVEEWRDRAIARLSTGERQRLALVRALIRGPRALLLDEPTTGLDGAAAAALESVIADARRLRGVMVLWVTHDDAQAARVASGSLIVRDGRVSIG